MTREANPQHLTIPPPLPARGCRQKCHHLGPVSDLTESPVWASADRIGYWVEHPDPPGEDTVAVARRQMTFAMSLPKRPGNRPIRYILSTHSPVLRAILVCYTGEDPGEPGYLEPIDLILSGNRSPELRFRGLRTFPSGAKVVGGVPR